jgi:nucleoid-associated protein YgaU
VQNLTIALVLIGLALLVGVVFILHQFGPDLGLTPLPDVSTKPLEEENVLEVTVGGGSKVAEEINEDARRRLSEQYLREKIAAIPGAIPASERKTRDEKGRIEHVVKKGETLSTLAREYLGDEKLWPAILEANPSLLRPEDLREGQTVLIPMREAR